MKPLTGQKKRIIEMLRRGDMPNHVFPAVGILKYTNRMSELNAIGYIIEARRVEKTGTWIYTLVEDPECSCICDGPLFCEIHREEGINQRQMMVDDALDEERHHGPR